MMIYEPTEAEIFHYGGSRNSHLYNRKDPSLCGSITRGLGYRNLAGRMAAMGGGEAKPYDREVQWHEFTGTQYFNTGISTSQIRKLTVDFIIKPFASIVGGVGNVFGACYYINASTLFRIYFSVYNLSTSQTSVNVLNSANSFNLSYGTSHTAVLDLTGNTVSIDSVSKNTTAISLPYTIDIGAIHVCANDTHIQIARNLCVKKVSYKGLSIPDGEFIPVVKDDVAYFYNGESFFRSEGTDDFGIGPDLP